MTSPVAELFGAAGLTIAESVPWGVPPSFDAPGIYVVSVSEDPAALAGPATCPISRDAVHELLAVRPELTVRGSRPDTETFAHQLERMWIPGATVLYIGRAGTSVRMRVRAYYRTALGARSPHSGGWPLKTLSNLGDLFVHVAACVDPGAAEERMIDRFVESVRSEARAAVSDPNLPLPFANLEDGRRRRKAHGIAGARASRQRGTAAADSASSPSHAARVPRAKSASVHGGNHTVKVTAPDITAGQIRVTRTPKRALGMPTSPSVLQVRLRGEPMVCRWDPRLGIDRERSGILRVGRERMADAFNADEEVTISRDGETLVVE